MTCSEEVVGTLRDGLKEGSWAIEAMILEEGSVGGGLKNGLLLNGMSSIVLLLLGHVMCSQDCKTICLEASHQSRSDIGPIPHT